MGVSPDPISGLYIEDDGMCFLEGCKEKATHVVVSTFMNSTGVEVYNFAYCRKHAFRKVEHFAKAHIRPMIIEPVDDAEASTWT